MRQQSQQNTQQQKNIIEKKATITTEKLKTTETQKKKLNYKEQRELDSLPEKIEILEQQINARSNEMNSSDYFKKPASDLVKLGDELNLWQQELDHCYQRWEELDQS